MPTRRTKLALAAGLSVLMVLLVVAACTLLGNPFDPFDDRQFTKAEWMQRNDGREAERRAGMAQDLVAHHLPRGMTTTDVEQLLGPLGEKQTKADAGGNGMPGAYFHEYDLGNWSSYGYDNAFLYVCFDDFDRLVHAEVNGY